MATRTISNTGGNWNSTTSWVEGAVPNVADNVVATATSGNLTVTANAAALSVNFTNYVGTFTVNSGITLTVGNNTTGGTFTMVSGMAIGATSTGTLVFNAAATLTSGGKVWPGSIRLSVNGSRTFTLGDAWSIDGSFLVTYSGSGQIVTLNANSLTIRGDVTIGTAATAVNSTTTGTCNIIFGTTTTQIVTTNITLTSATFTSPLTINASGTVTFTNPSAAFRIGSITYTSGTVVSTGASFLTTQITATFNTGGMIWDCPWSFQASASTYTFGGDFNISSLGSLTINNVTGACIFNGNNINLSCDLTMTFSFGGNISGTSIFNLLENCTVSQQSGMQLRNPLVINSTGTVTFSTNFVYNGASFTYTTGTFSMSNSLTWTTNVSGTYTINAAGFTFPNFVNTVNTTFAGSQGCNFYSYTCTTSGITTTFASSRTYTITNGLTLRGVNATRINFASSLAGTQSVLTVSQGADLDVGYANATDIDSSLGQTIWSYRGTLLRTNNWQQLPTQPKTVAYFNI